jgi:hypothetical protein
MPDDRDETEAQIRNLEITIASAPPEQQRQLRDVIESLRSSQKLRDMVAPTRAQQEANRAPLEPDVKAFFTPEPPTPIPTWVPDATPKHDVTDAMMRCPSGAKVYRLDTSISCGIPRGGGVPISHGLDLGFHPDGSLQHQDYYEDDLLKWSIHYHATHGRAREGFYADRAPLEQRDHGLVTQYDVNGGITSQQHFVEGVAHGWQKIWERDGYPVGAWLHEDGRIVEEVSATGVRTKR